MAALAAEDPQEHPPPTHRDGSREQPPGLPTDAQLIQALLGGASGSRAGGRASAPAAPAAPPAAASQAAQSPASFAAPVKGPAQQPHAALQGSGPAPRAFAQQPSFGLGTRASHASISLHGWLQDDESLLGSEFGDADDGATVVTADSEASRFATAIGHARLGAFGGGAPHLQQQPQPLARFSSPGTSRSGGSSALASDAAGGLRRFSLIAAGAAAAGFAAGPGSRPPGGSSAAHSSMVSDAHNCEMAGRRFSVASLASGSDLWSDAGFGLGLGLGLGLGFGGGGAYGAAAPAFSGRGSGGGLWYGGPGAAGGRRRASLVLDEDLGVGSYSSRRSSIASNTAQQSHGPWALMGAAVAPGTRHWAGAAAAGRRGSVASDAGFTSRAVPEQGSGRGKQSAAAGPAKAADSSGGIADLEWLDQSAAWGAAAAPTEHATVDAGSEAGSGQGRQLDAEQQARVELMMCEAAAGRPPLLATRSGLLQVGTSVLGCSNDCTRRFAAAVLYASMTSTRCVCHALRAHTPPWHLLASL
jgi:hypothetical protein